MLNKALHPTSPRVSLGVKRYATVSINRMVRLLKQVVNEAAGEETPEA